MSRLPWRDYSDFLADHFPGKKMQKISIDAGLSCPNRDGTKGVGGCAYCDNRSFTPGYCARSGGVAAQLAEGRRFFSRKYPSMRYLAYFQSHTNTYGEPSLLLSLYREALAQEGVDGIIIGTRPDCVSDDLLDSIAALPGWKMMEYGAESACDTTLAAVNRGHTWADTVSAVERTAARGVPVGIHLIMGLPGEDEETMMATVDAVNLIPVDTVKIHQLQLLRGTRLAAEAAAGRVEVRRYIPEEYAALCARIVRRLRPGIAIERMVSQAPPEMLEYPRWGLKNYEFVELVRRQMG